MKTLKEFIIESIGNLQFLLTSAEDAIHYFEEPGGFFSNKKIFKDSNKVKQFTKFVEDLYKEAEDYKKPCPIVGNYHNKPGFVFRRWVGQFAEDYSTIFDGLNINKSNGLYKGLHNTTIKEDNKFFPSSADYEYIIAYSHNKNNVGYGKKEDDATNMENIKFVGGVNNDKDITNTKLEQLMMYYNNNENSCIGMVKVLKNEIKSRLKKYPNESNVSDNWYKIGDYKRYSKKPNRTPKTDIISEDEKYRISVKKSVGAQLMSGGECESRATLMSCIELIDIEQDKKILSEMLQSEWYTPTKDGRSITQKKQDGDEELLNAMSNVKDMQNTLDGIFTRNEKFKEGVIYEALTGEIKFGKDDRASANYVLVWNETNPEKSMLYSVDDYLKKIKNDCKLYFAFKSSNNISYLSFRINV